MQTVGLIWIAVMSVWAFSAMGYDKRQAKNKASRIPEKNLWLLAIIGVGWALISVCKPFVIKRDIRPLA